MKILVSCFCNAIQKELHAKNYPHWQSLVNLLIEEGHIIYQLGQSGQDKLEGCEYLWDLKLNEIVPKYKELGIDFMIAVDNGIVHLFARENIWCVVLWSPSDSDIYGYPENLNIYKNKEKYLRDNNVIKGPDGNPLKDKDGYLIKDNQYGIWNYVPVKIESWDYPEKIIEKIKLSNRYL